MELVRSGVREDFLIPSLRDMLTEELQHLAKTEAADMRRESTRESFHRYAADPEFIGRFRDDLALRDPAARLMSDEDIASHLHDMAERLRPISHEEAQEAWSRIERWTERTSVISDQVIKDWHDRYTTRVLRDI